MILSNSLCYFAALSFIFYRRFTKKAEAKCRLITIKLEKFIMEKIAAPVSITKFTFGLFFLAASVAGCATNSVESEIPGQLNDGGWVMNIPGAPHTHRVVLAECPGQPVVTTHVHDHDQVGKGPHKHNGCFICPVNPSLASRLTN